MFLAHPHYHPLSKPHRRQNEDVLKSRNRERKTRREKRNRKDAEMREGEKGQRKGIDKRNGKEGRKRGTEKRNGACCVYVCEGRAWSRGFSPNGAIRTFGIDRMGLLRGVLVEGKPT